MEREEITYPLGNSDFLRVLTNSFKEFIEKGTSRSTAKLKPLHGAIARDLAEKLGRDYTVFSQGYGIGKETKIRGRYVNKAVDITVKKGETANIRCGNCPYFQIFIILDKLPYYQRSGELSRWETFTAHNAEKYVTLSQDDASIYFHTPNKTLIYVVHIPDNDSLSTSREYMDYYRRLNPSLSLTEHDYNDFGNGVIFNDYELFIEKVYHTIMAL